MMGLPMPVVFVVVAIVGAALVCGLVALAVAVERRLRSTVHPGASRLVRWDADFYARTTTDAAIDEFVPAGVGS